MKWYYWLLAILGVAIILKHESVRYRWPLVGVITSPFGMRLHPVLNVMRMHNGIDIDGETGDSVFAAASGVVIMATFSGSAGNIVKITHRNGDITSYMHLDSISVSEGQTVVKGQIIGTVGSTGAVTGSHLHFSIETPLGYVDPHEYLL